MGKYNFSTQKIADLEKRIAEMERRNHELERKLSECSVGLVINKKKRRLITQDINNKFEAKRLFCVKFKNDNRDPADIFKSNFHTFYQNIFRALDPVERKDDKRSGVVCKAVNELSEEEYKIYIDVLDSCIKTIDNGRTMLEEIGEKSEEEK